MGLLVFLAAHAKVSSLRGVLYEYGQVAPIGVCHIGRIAEFVEDSNVDLADLVREQCRDLLEQIHEKSARIEVKTKALAGPAKQSDTASRLQTMPGVGPLSVLAVEAFGPVMQNCRRGRDFAAWLAVVDQSAHALFHFQLTTRLCSGLSDLVRFPVVELSWRYGCVIRPGLSG